MSKKLLIMLVLATGIISLSSCANDRLVFLSTPLPIPDLPVLPKIPADALMCLSDQAFEDLVRRDVLQTQHIKRLEAIIRTTH